MKIYNTILIGCGYTSLGYACANKNALIIEKGETADTGFYLPLKNFKLIPYSPKTELGKELLNLYNSLGLFNQEMQNLNGFECGFCEFIYQKDIKILFKSRVMDIQKENDIYKLTLITSGGIDYVYAKEVLNLTNSTPDLKTLTILYQTDFACEVEEVLKKAFDGCVIEKAFFDNRYAVRIPINLDVDLNDIKIEIFEKWKNANPNAKILYFAPAFAKNYTTKKNAMQDGFYLNPIEAFEYGYAFAINDKEGK